MRCPACQESQLTRDELDANLITSACTACGGHWVRAFQYWQWRQKQGESLPPIEPDAKTTQPPAADSGPGKRCPECGTFLIRRQVGKGFAFHLDRCGHCGGIWFDRDEWDTLKQHNLHDDVHFVFTEAWQAAVRRDRQAQAEQRRLREQLGEVEYARLCDVQRWIEQHPQRPMILAALGIV
ncbi:zf-TFIIB domain-containing protein [Phycisphaerales bacterium AB-hyl4]|uniref:Zf-TFIIB domain-containing protein n=1 Tax=Natronomicrosphaera hydrolytica TaxID=3242702 RepID=A0ABV4UBT4_9BACT